MRGSKPMYDEKRINAVYRDTWMEFGRVLDLLFDSFVEARAMKLQVKVALLGVLLAGAREHEEDIRHGPIRGDLHEAEGLVRLVQEALEEVEEPRDLVTAASLLMDAGRELLEMHDQLAVFARERPDRDPRRGRVQSIT